MSLRLVTGDVALSGTLSSGANTSAPLAAPGAASDVLVMVHVTAVSGTSPTLNVTLEQSNDGSSWTAVPGSAAPQMIAVGSVMSNAAVTGQFVRVVATVGGTATPTFTGRVAVLTYTA